MFKKLVFIGLVVSSGFLSPSGFADQALLEGVYVDGGIGYGKINEEIVGFSRNVSGFMANANLGYKFNENLASEIGLTMFPSEEFGEGLIEGDENVSFDIAMKVIVPFGESFNFFGKAGVALASHRISSDFLGIDDKTTRPTALLVGGFGYNFNPQLGVLFQGLFQAKRDSLPAMYGVTTGISYII